MRNTINVEINIKDLTDESLLKEYGKIINMEEANKNYDKELYNALRDEYCKRSNTNSIWWHYKLQTAIYENR